MNFLTNINLSGNELQNARIQSLAAAPESPKAGQIYFDSGKKKYYGHNGTGWIDLGYQHPSKHATSDITGLDSALADKAPRVHEHTQYETTSASASKHSSTLKSAQQYADNAVAKLVGSAPGTLDTIEELADALGRNDNFAASMAEELGNKAPKVHSHSEYAPTGHSHSNYAASSHNHPSNQITLMTGYTKGASGTPILVGDSLNVAIGKLEKALDSKQPTGSYAPAVHSHGEYAKTSHGTHVPTPESPNNAKFLRNDNTWQTVTAANIGAADKGHSHSDYAKTSHGNHVPSIQSANNKVFLRNDNTWQTITPANIGAADRSHNHNGHHPRKYAADFGTSSTNVYKITHNLASEDVVVTIKEKASKQIVFADVVCTDANNITITLGANAPSSNFFRVVVIG